MSYTGNYWSCTKFADRVRGGKKPYALSGAAWQLWRKEHEKLHPIRYWLAEEGLNKLQNFVYWIPQKIDDLRIYIRNRWIIQSHCLVASPKDIPRGQWCDRSEALLYCMFGALVDFVEIEMAHMQTYFNKENKNKYPKASFMEGYLRSVWRCREAGLDHLHWSCGLTFDEHWTTPDDANFGKPTPQALAAMEIEELYLWYTVVRPNRPDPYEASGYDSIFDNTKDFMSFTYNEGVTDEIREAASNKLNEIEKAYLDEDTAMMERLVRVRHSLWT